MSDKKSEESVPVEEVKIQKMVSVGQIIKSVVVLLISFVCILLGISIYQVYRPLRDFHLVQPEVVKPVETPVKQEISVPDFKPENLFKEPLAVKTDEIPNEIVEKQKETEEPKKLEPIVEEVPTVSESIPTPVPQMEKLTLPEALTLRDKLYTGKSCFGEFQTLLKRELPSDLKDNLIAELMPICSVRPMYPELKSTFLKNKKEAFLTYYKMNNPKWLAYVKSFLTTLVDFRRLNPVKKKPKDMIYLSQNALMGNDLEKSLQHIQQLPPEIQSNFNEYMGLAKSYLTAQKEVEKLILSFDRKGE